MGAVDVSAQIAKCMRYDPDIIFGVGTVEHHAPIARDAKAAGYKGKLVMTTSAPADVLLDIVGPEVAEGIDCMMGIRTAGVNIEGTDNSGVEFGRELWEFAGRPGTMEDAVYLVGLGRILVIEEAFRLALNEVSPEELTRETLMEYGFRKIRNFDTMGLNSKISYPDDNHTGGSEIFIATITGGKLTAAVPGGWLKCVDMTKYYDEWLKGQ